jgi:hypothetical protein
MPTGGRGGGAPGKGNPGGQRGGNRGGGGTQKDKRSKEGGQQAFGKDPHRGEPAS